MASRGQHLVRADRRFATGGGCSAGSPRRLMSAIARSDRPAAGRGGIEAIFPDGSKRRLGFNSAGPVAMVHLHSWLALVRLALSGSVGWYKAWELGEWSSPDPVQLFELFSANARPLGDIGRAKGLFRLINAAAHRLRDNAPRKARENIAAHYDLGNDFYSAWLDETMTYSSALFRRRRRDAGDRAGRKVALLLDRLDLKPGQRLLEIGCGWGSLAIAAARRGATVVGLTLSTEQKDWAERRIAEAGLADRIEIRLQDYRDTDETVRRHRLGRDGRGGRRALVGPTSIASPATSSPAAARRCNISSIDHALFAGYRRSADFIQTYIFPGGMLVDEPALCSAGDARGLSLADRDGFALDYAETLKRWRKRYDDAVKRGDLAGFDDAFHRLWRYYLMYCEGGFRGGAIDVAQVTLIKA